MEENNDHDSDTQEQSLLDKTQLLKYAKDLQNGTIDGNVLKEKVDQGLMTKLERRKITRLAKKVGSKDKEEGELTERQKLRRLTKEKKMLPKLDKEQKRKKYLQDLEDKREQESAKFTICLGCRKRGHFVKNCPNKPVAEARRGAQICYFCGSNDHSLKDCSEYNGDESNLPFAKCFICQETGHLSRNCSGNTHGLYPKGGCCHVCGEITHLARNCPKREED